MMDTFGQFRLFENIRLLFRSRASSPDEERFSSEWKKRSAAVYGTAALYMMGAYHLGSLTMDVVQVLRGHPIGLPWLGGLTSLLLIGAWSYFKRSLDLKLVYVYIFITVLTMLSIGYRISTFPDHPSHQGHLPMAAHIGYTMMAAVSVAMMPSTGVILPVVLMSILFAILHTAWLPFSEAWPALRLSMTFFIGAALFHQVLGLKSTKEARREFQARALLETFEKARLDQDLLLARRIQDSLSGYNQQDFRPFSRGILQQRFSQVGGDWVALRSDQSGALYVLVADAAGKGIQAALVLHAVQSLWAESLGKSTFDPEEWLRRVNMALCQLGAKKPHMLTMGIAKFGYNSCTYYSAGHLPLFLVDQRTDGGQEDVKILLAPGTPVGLIEKLTIGRAKVEYGENFVAFLGSDGYFQTGSHQKKKAILRLKERLEAGENVLEGDGQSGDDQTLIWIKRDPTLKRA